jgi:hypothetical protein
MGRAHVSHPIANTGRYAGRPGWGNRPGYRPGLGWGLAAAGAGIGYAGAYGGYYGGGDYYGYDTSSSYGSYAADDGTAYCARRYRSFDAQSGTFLANNGHRYYCPSMEVAQ